MVRAGLCFGVTVPVVIVNMSLCGITRRSTLRVSCKHGCPDQRALLWLGFGFHRRTHRQKCNGVLSPAPLICEWKSDVVPRWISGYY